MNRVAHFTGGVVSGAIFGKSLYVNNARYYYPPWGENWVTKLNRHAVEPVDLDDLSTAFDLKRVVLMQPPPGAGFCVFG